MRDPAVLVSAACITGAADVARHERRLGRRGAGHYARAERGAPSRARTCGAPPRRRQRQAAQHRRRARPGGLQEWRLGHGAHGVAGEVRERARRAQAARRRRRHRRRAAAQRGRACAERHRRSCAATTDEGLADRKTWQRAVGGSVLPGEPEKHSLGPVQAAFAGGPSNAVPLHDELLGSRSELGQGA